MPTLARPRLLAICLAEATLDLIIPWAKSGQLPTFKRLMDHGAWGASPLRFHSSFPNYGGRS